MWHGYCGLLLLLLLLSCHYSSAFLLPPLPEGRGGSHRSSSVGHLSASSKGGGGGGGGGGEEEDPTLGGGPIARIFSVFFGKKEARPLGFKRYDRDSNPEAFPAVVDEFAAPLPKDSNEVAQLRRLLARTQLEKLPLRVAYDANKDGWNREAFAKKVYGQKAGLVVGKTKAGAVFGGYNPDGWFGYGDELSCIAAFLFTWRTGKLKEKPMKMRKIGGASFAINDVPGKGIQFGYEDLRIKLDRGFDAKLATSRLNQAYEKPPDGINTLFAKGERDKADLVDLKVYVAAERP